MNWNQVEAQWMHMKTEAKSQWAKLTDDDIKNLGAKKDMLVRKIQERYGIMKDEAERQVDDWLTKLSPRRDDNPAKGNPNPSKPM